MSILFLKHMEMSESVPAHSKNIQQRRQERKYRIIKFFFLNLEFLQVFEWILSNLISWLSLLRGFIREVSSMQFLGMLREKSKNLRPLWMWELGWYFLCQIKSNSLLERRTPKQKLWAVVIHFPSPHKPFSDTAQKEMNWNYLGHRKKANPWKGS